MLKKIILCFIFTIITTSLYGQVNRWGVQASFLVQNNGLRELTTITSNGTLYSRQFNLADVANSNASLGLSIGGSFDRTFKNGAMFRLQSAIETTGNFLWTTDIGTGIRIPTRLAKKHYLSVEVYFSFAQSFGSLDRIGVGFPEDEASRGFYLALFGIKTRVAYEFPLSKNYFISPFVSYVAYPWKAAAGGANGQSNVFLNGVNTGAVLDGFYIGLEFGSKF